MGRTMKGLFVLSVITATCLTAGCANIQRSRDLANPAVPPTVTAVQVCAGCHGLDGVSKSPTFPRLAGQSRDYLVSQLQGFRAHQRADPAGYEYMWGLTRHLSDDQIAGLADYFSAQTPRANAPGNSGMMALGKSIFEQGDPARATLPCSSCHGAHGEGMAVFPRLANQHSDYLVKQLLVFQKTEQRPGTAMTQISHNLTHQEIDSVAAFLQGMPIAK
jgi:cytochrome c553